MEDPERSRFPDTKVNAHRMHIARLERLRAELRKIGCAGGLFYDPINIRYATGTSNMQVYSLHNPCRYVFVATDGPVILFDFKGCGHLSRDYPAVDEARTAIPWYHFVTGTRVDEKVRLWASEIADLLRLHGRGERTLAVDRLDPPGLRALEELGVRVVDGQAPANYAKVIKTEDELVAIKEAIYVCEEGMRRMDMAREPGITEMALWAHLHEANIELGGEWIETRLLNSGPRTNPWYQEASARVIQNGDMIAFDSDLIGPHGYSADISRSWIAGDRSPTDDQRRLYEAAHRQVHANIELFRPGMTYREIAEYANVLPSRYFERQNACVAHGIGLCNEYPLVMHKRTFEGGGHDGVVEENMVFCVESFVGDPYGGEGVKLEEQILVTATGPVKLSSYVYEEQLL
ncbi:M24 family metallopeptidase [Ensifer adhaerens]|uniref:M24 family metallopeptidase n=1 Tax=Ensifer adhaerens TaxID=106592 RepID=UPI00132EDDA6|nr:Xaa-Pro peptidase family protein [Ensifer adhaerens]QHG74953.1 aminopeptidase P family protein [Ensifer adhaerens]